MGCTPSKTGFGKRKMGVNSSHARLKAIDRQALEAMFNRIQQGKTIKYQQFASEILASSVPQLVSSIIFCLFASPTHKQGNDFVNYKYREAQSFGRLQAEPSGEQIMASTYFRTEAYLMTFDDLIAMYMVFTHPLENEKAELIFQFVYWLREQRIYCNGGKEMTVTHQRSSPRKSQKNLIKDPLQERKLEAMNIQEKEKEQVKKEKDKQEMLCQDDMLFYFEHVINASENDLELWYDKAKINSSKTINKSSFMVQFNYFKESDQVFSWLLHIMKGASALTMNVPPSIKIDKFGKDHSLTMGFQAKAKKQAESQGLTNEEVQNIQRFYDSELKGKDAKSVLKVFNRMFRDVKNSKLRKYLMESVSQVQSLNFSFLCDLALFMCRKDGEQVKLEFLFDVFTKQRTGATLRKAALRDFCEIFKLSATVFPNAQQVNRKEFISNLDETMVDFEIIYGAKYMMIALMQLSPQSDEEERNAILSVLNQNPNIETYIYENLHEEKTFYVLEKKFWDEWCVSMSFFNETGKYNLKKENKNQIKNVKLLEPRHKYRMQEVVYNEDFVLLPKHVFFPLSTWYKCDQIITREVISWRSAVASKLGRLDSMGSRNSARFMMSNQKFFNPQEETFEVDLQKKVGDTIYELEVYPKLIYISQIMEKGVKEHKDAFVNRKLNQKYLKKYSASKDSLPFQELQMSKKETLYQVLANAAKLYGKNAKKGRLHIDHNIFAGVQLIVSLEDCALQEGTLVYVEFANDQNEWPSDKSLDQKIAKQTLKDKSNEQTTTGLVNLGNTCYMNAALQCVVNLKPLFEYFVESGLYLKQINRTNFLGHSGVLVEAFADLMKKMWQNPGGVTNPRDFKNAIATCAENFAGNDQQDSQEYLAFLIDGLHEELNLRKKKPYIKNPESEGRKTTDLGLEYWSNNLRRDWSFVFFTFYGMARSKLNCKQCTQETSTFESFSQMSVSLPEPAHQVLTIVVHRLPNRVREQCQGKNLGGHQTDLDSGASGMMDLDSGRSPNDTHSAFSSVPQRNRGYTVGQRVQSSESNRERQDSQKFTEAYMYNTNDLPISICVKVDNESTFGEITKKIAQIREVNIEPSFAKSELLITILDNKMVYRMIFADEKLSAFNTYGMVLHAFEVVNRIGRDIMSSEIVNMGKQQKEVDHHLTTWQDGYKQSLGCEKKFFVERKELLTPQNRQATNNKIHLLHFQMYNPQNYSREQKLQMIPKDVIIVCYQRHFVRKDNPFLQTGTVQLVSDAIMLCVPATPQPRLLYEEVWAQVQNQLQADSPIRNNVTQFWWQAKEMSKTMKRKQAKGNLSYEPFCLRYVQRDGRSCSICHWKNRCAGCMIIPGSEEHKDHLLIAPFVAIDWHPTLLEEQYNPTSNELLEHSTVSLLQAEAESAASSVTSLDDCLVKYHKREELEDKMKCKTCKNEQTHYKTVDLFQPPPVLVIQLKRFKAVPNSDRWRKLNSIVDFPIYNLDLSDFIVDKDLINRQLGLETKYDLSGYVNHMGTLGNGHYTSNVRNPFTKKWHIYDDNIVTEIPETSMAKEHAYLLFYIRKDMQGKQLRGAFPNIEAEYFPGKPIQTKTGQDGFVIGVHGAAAHRGSQKEKGPIVIGGSTPNPDEVTIKLVEEDREGESLNVRRVELADEKDKDVIVYDKAELKEALTIRKRKSEASLQLQRQQVESKSQSSSSCCRPMCCFSKKGAVTHASDEDEEGNPMVQEEMKSNTITPSSRDRAKSDVSEASVKESKSGRRSTDKKKISNQTPQFPTADGNPSANEQFNEEVDVKRQSSKRSLTKQSSLKGRRESQARQEQQEPEEEDSEGSATQALQASTTKKGVQMESNIIRRKSTGGRNANNYRDSAADEHATIDPLNHAK